MTTDSTTETAVETPIAVNDIVIPNDTIGEVQFMGVPGYAIETSDTTVKVAFYHAEKPGEPAFVFYKDFLRTELYRVGQCNPAMIPNPPAA